MTPGRAVARRPLPHHHVHFTWAAAALAALAAARRWLYDCGSTLCQRRNMLIIVRTAPRDKVDLCGGWPLLGLPRASEP